MNLRAAVVLALGLILAALAHGGIYTMTTSGGESAFAYRINRFTGEIEACLGFKCRPAE